MRLWKSAVIIAALSLAGCASTLMKPAENQALTSLAPQTSRIVFLRPSSFGGAIQASLFDVTHDDLKFLGISSTGTKVVYDVAPGSHRLMVVSEAADFMEANLAAGKTYYAVVTPRMGAWKARFSLWPVKARSDNKYNLQNKDLESWIREGTLVTNTPESEQWFTANTADIRNKQTQYLAVWQQKSAAELAERTLEEEDGVVVP